MRANLLAGLPFHDDLFDFVQQRLLQSGVPLVSWSGVVNDLVRVTRPGGWIELVEVENQVKAGGPATTRLLELLLQLAGSRGLDRSGVIFRQLDDYLRLAGLVEVQRRDVDVPLGDWGGRIGSLMASDLRALYTRLSDVFKRSGVTAPATVRCSQVFVDNAGGPQAIAQQGEKVAHVSMVCSALRSAVLY